MNNEDLLKKLTDKHSQAIKGSMDRFGLEIQIEPSQIADIVKFLRDDPEMDFNMLIDLVSIDYSVYPNYSGERFGLAYLLKSLSKGHRVQLKATVLEEKPLVPTVSHLYANANWLEREAFDQMGIRFE